MGAGEWWWWRVESVWHMTDNFLLSNIPGPCDEVSEYQVAIHLQGFLNGPSTQRSLTCHRGLSPNACHRGLSPHTCQTGLSPNACQRGFSCPTPVREVSGPPPVREVSLPTPVREVSRSKRSLSSPRRKRKRKRGERRYLMTINRCV